MALQFQLKCSQAVDHMLQYCDNSEQYLVYRGLSCTLRCEFINF